MGYFIVATVPATYGDEPGKFHDATNFDYPEGYGRFLAREKDGIVYEFLVSGNI